MWESDAPVGMRRRELRVHEASRGDLQKREWCLHCRKLGWLVVEASERSEGVERVGSVLRRCRHLKWIRGNTSASTGVVEFEKLPGCDRELRPVKERCSER